MIDYGTSIQHDFTQKEANEIKKTNLFTITSKRIYIYLTNEVQNMP